MSLEAEPATEVIQAVAPGVLWTSAKVGAASGIAGLALGGVAGTIRSTTPLLFSIASGIQCSAIGGIYTAARQSSAIFLARRHNVEVSDLSLSQKINISTASGGFVGGSAALLFRGRANVVPGVIVFSLLGYLGQSVANKLEHRSLNAQPEQALSMGQRIVNSRFNPMRRLSDEDYKHMLSEKVIRIEAEIALIDEDISKLQSQTDPSTNRKA